MVINRYSYQTKLTTKRPVELVGIFLISRQLAGLYDLG